ncbi:MAG: S46 family peptidase, partial [Acidobacteria bacterium]|nr:S46 family peptidase [Acidobacteriota bacterium]
MRVRKLALLIATVMTPLVAHAGEGMWMPQQVPLFEEQLGALGMTVDAKSFADLTGFPMGAVISLGGCTASFVSPQGLVVTNHHCAFGSIQHNSTPERDLTVTGFLARSLDEELPARPDARIFVTTKIDDVTEHLRGKIDPGLTGAKRQAIIEERTKSMIAECERPGGVRCRIASFFEGSMYQRITQMEVRDVRLVYAPAEGVGNYGGDVDNYMWPRHTGDFSFYRAYVGRDGKPADYSKDNVPYSPKHWLKVSTGELNEGDLVIVAGYPGRTSRHITADEFRVAQEFRFPRSIEHFKAVLEILRGESARSDDARIRLASKIESNANQLKRFEGTWEGMSKGNLLERKRADEAELKAWIAAEPARAKQWSGALEEIAKLNERGRARMEADFVESWLTRGSTLLSEAQTIQRLALERQKKDAQRKAGYQERDLPRIKAATARSQKTLELASDRALLGHFLRLATALPAGQRIAAVDEALAATGESTSDARVETLLDRLYANTKLTELSERNAMLLETPAQLAARNDSCLDFAAALLPAGLEREKLQDDIAGSMALIRPKYMDA